MQLSHVKPTHAHKSRKRIARGGKRGATAGRGTKGQKSRAGHRIRPAERDMIKKIPKLRGYRFKSRAPERTVINLSEVNRAFAAGEKVTPASLAAKGLVSARGGRALTVKILGDGALTKKVFVEGCAISASAAEKITKAGGTIKE